MKLATYKSAGSGPRVGLVDGDRVLDFHAVAENMLALLDAGEAGMERLAAASGEASHAIADVQLLAPVPRPRSIRDCMCFEQHLIQATRTVARWRVPALAWLANPLIKPPRVWYERPVYYKGNPASVVGPEADVLWPAYTGRMDFELEFGIFIGRQGRDIPASKAASYIAGYTIFNDFSARDVQMREMQGRLGPAKGKDFDTGNVLGPYLVTPDDVPDPYNLKVRARVNGEQWSESSTADMQFSFEEIIEYVSRGETLYPGDFIGAGTTPNGCGLELDRWLAPGDVVELEVERLGTLRNRVVREESPHGPQ